MFSFQDKKFIIALARRAIEHYFKYQSAPLVDPKELPVSLKKPGACFVTLRIGSQLRGCIGSIEASRSLYLDIIDNAVAAAFFDPRFSTLTMAEYPGVELEVSVLSAPAELKFNSADELLTRLRPGVDGVILRQDERSATYLPQVWEELPDKERFLSSLCLKAGLDAFDWRKAGVRVWTYQAETILEHAPN